MYQNMYLAPPGPMAPEPQEENTICVDKSEWAVTVSKADAAKKLEKWLIVSLALVFALLVIMFFVYRAASKK